MSACKLIGHRGFPQKYPENTLRGLKAALDLGADGVEFDVHLSRDGVPVLFHDESFDRTADLAGSIRDTDAAEIAELSVHEPGRFGDKFYPTFASTLHAVSVALKNYDALFFIELKRKTLKTFTREIFLQSVLTASESLADKRVLISFDWDILNLAKSESSLPIGWVIEKYDKKTLKKIEKLAPDYVISNYKKLPYDSPLWAGGWQWFVYDIVDPVVARLWMERGVACIETWDIDALLPLK